MNAEYITNWINEYCNSYNIKSLVIGISGGVDSALTSALCAKTGKNTILVSMPILQDKVQLSRASKHMQWLDSKYDNVKLYEKDLTEVFLKFKELFPQDDQLALANSRARLRMTTLYQIAQMNAALVVGTGNKVEDFGVGFFTKYGDGGVDISPIADLMKSQVKELAKQLGVSDEITNAAPTDGLWEDSRTDEDQLGATYDELEWAMTSTDGVMDLTNRQIEVLRIYETFNKQNKHKMVSIPICKLGE